jgi:signal transduction histidine kinase
VPILHGDEALGVLNVEGDQAFDDLDRVSLEIVAEYLGVAIVNARLFESAKHLALLEERQRLARDLHDNVTQILSSMSLITQSLNDAWQRDPAEAGRRAARLGELARLAFAELRAMLHELAPRTSSPAVSATPQRLSARLHRLLHAMVPPYVRLDLETGDCPPQIEAHEEAILRVCQEAVSNAVRHAAPSRIRVSVSATASELHLRVIDDGHGIGKSAPRGRGLDNMRERLTELGGRLRIARRRPHGTLIVARVPRHDRSTP